MLVPGGFGIRAVEGKMLAANYARENGVPYLGICLPLSQGTPPNHLRGWNRPWLLPHERARDSQDTAGQVSWACPAPLSEQA